MATSSPFFTESSTSGQPGHLFPDWSCLSFLDESDDNDVEVSKTASNRYFDPVVGGRNSTRSSSSRSSAGSTGFYESVQETSPSTSLSPYAFVSIECVSFVRFRHIGRKRGASFDTNFCNVIFDENYCMRFDASIFS